MAKCKKSNSENVLLGFEDELITEKYKSNVGYWTNKIGGCPDWPLDGIRSPNCQLCGLVQPLIVQVYAPLENSSYHRTLYIFSCINPNCWNQNDSWTCIRSQLIDSEYEATCTTAGNVKAPGDWCLGADDWDDDNGNFENGNVIRSNKNQHYPSDNESDDDSSSLSAGIGNLNVDECNANWGGATVNLEKGSGAVGKQSSPTATAEIEGDEGEVVSIDTPTAPQRDLIALLQETASVPYYLRSGERNQNNSISFISFFISVGEELNMSYHSDHVRDLIQEYQQNHGDILHMSQGGEGCDSVSEKYEKAIPAHGDKMFHNFISIIQANPGQVIRYCRESNPVLLYPLNEYPKKCNHCNGDLVFELQLLPTLIPKLKFPDDSETHLEFGNVLVYTCKRSCWSSDDKLKKEKVIVQIETT